jgi:hypothetical protein
MASKDVHMEDLVDSTTDWSSSDSDDSDLDEVLNDDDMEVMLVLFGMKQMEDRAKLLDQRKGSTMGRVCIPRNRALGHEQLMQDYFAEVPTYPPCPGIRGLLARTSFRPVESEYRVLYSRFTGQKNRGSVRHALMPKGPKTAKSQANHHCLY